MEPKINIGIPEPQREEIANGLSRLLADTFTLYLMTHRYHWNVQGPMFSALHTLFEEQYTALWNSVDEIAERIRALDEVAPGTYADFSRLSSIQEHKELPNAKGMIQKLLEGHEAVARTSRSVFPAAEKGQDEATIDLLTQRIQYHEKTAWMLRSLLRD
ncbi:MAG: Dps family protein [Bdellovibrionales bacterium]